MNKSSHAKQFLLPGCECYCTAAPIPFDRYALILRSRPRQLSSAPWWYLTVPVPVRSGLQDISTILRSVSMCSIWLGGLPLNIPGAFVHTFQWGGVPPSVSSPGCSNPQQGYNQFRFPLFLVAIRSCSLSPVEAGSSGTNSITSVISQFRVSQIRANVSMLMCLPSLLMLAIIFVVIPPGRLPRQELFSYYSINLV